MTEHTHEAVADAMRIAEEVSPAPARAAAALKILTTEVLLRWEQRTALSFRLQDLRGELVKAGIPDDSPLYIALHEVTATAEAWMHPDTLSDAARDHLAWIKAELQELQTGAVGAFLAERKRQISVEGWTPEHDDEHPPGELERAAACYATWSDASAEDQEGSSELPRRIRWWWPWALSWFKPTTTKRNLEKAGALLIAAYERELRAEARNA
ncbi:MAG TPA: hypothetical protein VGE09_06350 [Pseudoxanthomonas sp.]